MKIKKKRKTPTIAELVRPIRSTNSTEHNRVQSTLNFNTSNEVTHISINKPNKNTSTQSTNLNSNTTNNNNNQNSHTKINSQNAETGFAPISQQQTSQSARKATENQSGHISHSQTKTNNLNLNHNTTPSTYQQHPHTNESQKYTPANGSYASNVGTPESVPSKPETEKADDPLKTAAKIKVPSDLLERIT